MEEVNVSLKKNHTWLLIDLSLDKVLISYDCLFKAKQGSSKFVKKLRL